MSAFQISSFFDQQFPSMEIRLRNDLIHFTLIMYSVVLFAGGGRKEGLFYGKVVANWEINLLFCFRA